MEKLESENNQPQKNVSVAERIYKVVIGPDDGDPPPKPKPEPPPPPKPKS